MTPEQINAFLMSHLKLMEFVVSKLRERFPVLRKYPRDEILAETFLAFRSIAHVYDPAKGKPSTFFLRVVPQRVLFSLRTKALGHKRARNIPDAWRHVQVSDALVFRNEREYRTPKPVEVDTSVLDDLSDACREYVTLRHVKGLTRAQVELAMGIDRNTYQRLKREFEVRRPTEDLCA